MTKKQTIKEPYGTGSRELSTEEMAAEIVGWMDQKNHPVTTALRIRQFGPRFTRRTRSAQIHEALRVLEQQGHIRLSTVHLGRGRPRVFVERVAS